MTERDISRLEDGTPTLERGDHYKYVKSTEKSSRAHALLARQVHAASYLGEGFINDDAVDQFGQIMPDIDKARGESVDYYLGFNAHGDAVSTLRKVSMAEGEGIESLPGYQLCKDTLSDTGRSLLDDAIQGSRPIREISSFGHVPKESAIAGLELLRHVLQESYGTDEVWFFTMVTQKYQTLVNLFGPKVVRKIGEEVPIIDARVGDVSLTPAYVDTTRFFDDIKDGILEENDVRKRKRLLGSLRNFAKGVARETLSDEVRLLLDDGNRFDFMEYIQASDIQRTPIEWSQPLQLDLNDRIDALYSKRLIDEGKVRTVTAPTWSEEFPDSFDANEIAEHSSWFYYPWSESLVQFPDKSAYRTLRGTRDRHLVTEDEQAQLYEKSTLFAGLSVGSHVLQHMVYAGVGGSHALADFDTISVSNLNRIRVGMGQVGERKTDAFAKRVSELDPYLQLQLLHDGVTKESLTELVQTPHIVFDEVDDFAAKALLRMYAKEHKLPLIMATDVGYKSIIDVERHDLKETKPFNGRINQETIEAMLAGTLSPQDRMKITTKLIGLSNASFRLLQSVSDSSLAGFPQLDVTASQGGALATIVARDILLGREVPSGRRVHDARSAMKLSGEVPMRDGLKILTQFLANS